MEVKSSTYCPDCGPVAVSHTVERWNARLDSYFSILTYPAELLRRALKPIISLFRPGRLIPTAAKVFAAVGLGSVIEKPDEKLNWRARILWEEAERRGIVMREFRPFGLDRELFFATYKNDTRGFDGLPRPRNAHDVSLDWMDDKGIILKRFKKAGIPVPRGGTAKTMREAQSIFENINGAVIVKPALGSRSRHTYLHIRDIESLQHAFQKARELSPRVVIEEELPGFVFRITLVALKIAGVMRREPPHVTGDGKQTIQELVAEENKNPKRRGPIFHELHLDREAELFIKNQDFAADAIPPRGRMVLLYPKVSRTFGASTTEIETKDIHPDNQKLFLDIGVVLDDPLVGVDFMIEDLKKSWKEQTCGVIECNSLPFIDLHHFPLKGPTRNVAGMVWDIIFPESGT